jgi:hypothetical protein
VIDLNIRLIKFNGIRTSNFKYEDWRLISSKGSEDQVSISLLHAVVPEHDPVARRDLLHPSEDELDHL